MSGTLFIVATPIGNLSDITARALDVLKASDIIYAEDTRVTSKLLAHFSIDKRVLIYNQHSSITTQEQILNELLAGNSISFVSDAGTPGISDPGNELVSFISNASNYEVPIVPIPGASSLTAALSICGFDVTPHIFLGFLPKRKRQKLFNQLKEYGIPVVFFDSPFRINKTLDELVNFFGEDIEIYIGRELTKLHETSYRGTLQEVKVLLSNSTVKGEFVCVLNVKKAHLHE